MASTVRIGICSWADEGLLRAWYPRGVSTGERRLRYYAQRFDVVEVDSPYYALPDPAVTERWARRTPDAFTFHVKASAAMTWHDGEPTDEAFALFRASLEPLELSGKLRGILLQYHPRFTKSPKAMAELARAPARLAPLVPLVEFRHRSWMDEDERADTLSFLERHGLAYVSVDTPATRAANVSPRVAASTGRVAYVRFHGRNVETWNIRGGSAADRFDWLYAADDLADWVAPLARLADEADEVYAMFNNNRDDFAPRSAQVLRGLLDEAGVPATGGVEPPATELTLF
ncbi:MAG TPA: DUF72 domain-containing protein [Gaiella sp.]